MKAITRFLNDRARLARYLFCLDAVLGVFSIGSAVFFGTAYTSASFAEAFFPVFLPFSVLWLLFCYGAYKGLTGRNVFGKLVFWISVIGHFFVFPIGTAFSGVCLLLWRDLSARLDRKEGTAAALQPVPAEPLAPRSPE